MFANNMMAVMNLGFPDVCLTPMGPVVTPVPYPNISTTDMAIPTAPTILIGGTPAQNLLSIVTFSQGDDTGVLGGVACGMDMGPTMPILGSFVLLLDGMFATRLTSMNTQNLINAPGMTITPGQVCMLVLS